MEDHPTAEPLVGGIWSGSQRLLTVGLTLMVTSTALEALAVATTMPATVRDLGGLSYYGWAFSAFMLTNLVGITLAGDEADRRGPALPFALGVALFTLGLLIAGLAPAMLLVVAGRAVQGLGAGFIGSVAYVAVGRGYPEASKPRMLAVLATAWVVPGLVGPALAGLVAAHLGWRWVFLGLAPLPPLAAILALPMLGRLEHPAVAPATWVRAAAALRLAIGTALVLAGLGQALLPLAAGLTLAGMLVGLPALRRLLPSGALGLASGLPASVATAGLLNLAFFGVDAFVPLTLTAIRGQSIATAGIPLTAATLGWTAGSWLQAHLAPTQGRRLLVESGLAFIAVGVGGIIAVLLAATPSWLATLAWAVAGLGMGLGFSTISLVVLETAARGQEGAASASFQLANVLGSALGTGGGGAIIGHGGATTASSAALLAQDLLMLGALGVTALAAARMGRRLPPSQGDDIAAVARTERVAP
ncbi:MAG TPA: MFS transporter [Chloroflexota bacterium]|nr:MFS transporter [Chloroflexota bacterium]